MPNPPAQTLSRTEQVRQVVREIGPEKETADIRAELKRRKIKVDDTIIRQVKRQVADERAREALERENPHHPDNVDARPEPAAKKPGKKEQPLGAGKEALFEMFRTQGTGIDYATAHRQLNGKGLQIGAEWFRRLKHEYIAQHGESQPVATVQEQQTGTSNGQQAGAEAGAVSGAAAAPMIPVGDGEANATPPIVRHGVEVKPKPGPVQMIRSARRLIEECGSKEEAIKLIEEL